MNRSPISGRAKSPAKDARGKEKKRSSPWREKPVRSNIR
jgi:hypothetical protein